MALKPDSHIHLSLHLYTEQGVIAFTTGNGGYLSEKDRFGAGLVRCTCYVPANLLNSGRHSFVLFFVRDGSSIVYRHDSAVSFEILDRQERSSTWYGKEPGVVQPILRWDTDFVEDDHTGITRADSYNR